MSRAEESSTWKKARVPRGKHHNKTETKTTVSTYVSRNAIEKARKHKLNISRITEQALNSILDYLENQNIETTAQASSDFLGKASFPKEGLVPWTGFNPGHMKISPAKFHFFFCTHEERFKTVRTFSVP